MFDQLLPTFDNNFWNPEIHSDLSENSKIGQIYDSKELIMTVCLDDDDDDEKYLSKGFPYSGRLRESKCTGD